MLNKEDISDITFVDCDSMQIDKYQSLVTTVEFTAPENVGKDTKKYYTTFESENYSLFVLLFYIIMAGAHPYSQIVSTNSEEISFNEKVRRGMFPYFSEDATNKYGNFTVRLNWAYLPGYLRNAFINVGYYRGENFAKEKRLSSQEWLTLFKKYYEDLTNGRLKAIDSKYNVGVYEPWPRAIPSEVYKKFDIKQFMQISSREQGFKLDLVVNKLLNNANLDLITYDPYNIVKLLKRKDIYKKDKLTIMLKKNLGFYYDLMLEYEKCE